jgi:hypothetical protein
MGLFFGMLSEMGSVLSNIVLILLTVTFILLEASSFPIKLRSIYGEPHLVFPQFTKFVNDIQRYMIIKTIISFTAAAILTLWLIILGVDFPILWGFVALLPFLQWYWRSFNSVRDLLHLSLPVILWLASHSETWLSRGLWAANLDCLRWSSFSL